LSSVKVINRRVVGRLHGKRLDCFDECWGAGFNFWSGDIIYWGGLYLFNPVSFHSDTISYLCESHLNSLKNLNGILRQSARIATIWCANLGTKRRMSNQMRWRMLIKIITLKHEPTDTVAFFSI